MLLISKSRSNISPFDNKKGNENEVIQRKIFKTWHEVMSSMQIDTVELPWNADGTACQKILRKETNR